MTPWCLQLPRNAEDLARVTRGQPPSLWGGEETEPRLRCGLTARSPTALAPAFPQIEVGMRPVGADPSVSGDRRHVPGTSAGVPVSVPFKVLRGSPPTQRPPRGPAAEVLRGRCNCPPATRTMLSGGYPKGSHVEEAFLWDIPRTPGKPLTLLVGSLPRWAGSGLPLLGGRGQRCASSVQGEQGGCGGLWRG